MESLIFGINPVAELLKSERPVNRILVSRESDRKGPLSEILALIRKRGIPYEWAEKRILDRKSSSGKHQGVIAFVAPKGYCDIEDVLEKAAKKSEAPLVVLLDGIEDPQNLGAVIRSAECAGAHGVVIPKRRAAQLTESVAKASSGAVEHMMVARVSNIAETIQKLKNRGIWVIGIEAGETKTVYEVDMKLPTAIVVGGESKGISRLVKERCEVLASIPLKGKVSSLNASAATAVALFEAVRQRICP